MDLTLAIVTINDSSRITVACRTVPGTYQGRDAGFAKSGDR